MGRLFEEIDYRPTPLGPIILRRRWVAAIDQDVVEVLLGDEHLMSSLFTAGEIALADLGLARAPARDLRVVVGGLGLGYTANAALGDPRVSKLDVVDALQPVIEWHRAGLVPLEPRLADDGRCSLCLGDFFGWFDQPRGEGERYDAVLLDIDHSPTRLLNPAHARFYTEAGLRRMKAAMAPDGVFALWSDDAPEPGFTALLHQVFGRAAAEVVTFANPLTHEASTCTIYVAGGV